MGKKISLSIYGQTNLILQSKQCTSEDGSFRLDTKAGLLGLFLLSEQNEFHSCFEQKSFAGCRLLRHRPVDLIFRFLFQPP